MDKKSIGIVVALGVILVGIVVAVLVYDAKINTNIIEINNIKYSKSDFETYLKVAQYENGDEEIDVTSALDGFAATKLYSQYADAYKLKLPSGEEVKALTDSEIEKLKIDYNLTENEYMTMKTEIARANYIYANIYDFWKVSDEDYEEHKGENADKFKMYDYRVLQVAVESEPETSGEVSGDVSGDVSGEVSGDNSEEARKASAKAKAIEAMEKIKSGEKFEDVAKEYGTTRITFTNGGYNIVNGTLETNSALYLNEMLWEKEIAAVLPELEKGEYSEIIEGEGSYSFVYMEDIRDGLDKYDDQLYRREIALGHIQGETKISPANRMLLKSINMKDLVPALSKVDDKNGEASGDTNDVVTDSGDTQVIDENTENAMPQESGD